VAGAAALLRSGAPRATGAQIRNAVVAGANPRLLGDHPTAFDQGAGFLDVSRSLELLREGRVSGAISSVRGEDVVAHNLEEMGLKVRKLEGGESFSTRTGALVPGERSEIYVETGRDVAALRIDVAASALLPPAQQNQIWGDDVVVAVHSAKTSSIGEGDYRAFEVVAGTTSFTVTDLDTGVTRVTPLGDWTNAGSVRADIRVTAVPARRPTISTHGVVGDGGWVAIPVSIPPGTARASFELGWKRDWGHTPTNDIDLYVVDPAGYAVDLSGATLNAPERTVVDAPVAGDYTVLVNGYFVFGDRRGGSTPATDEYRLNVYLE
jgi:hypothetical protein